MPSKGRGAIRKNGIVISLNEAGELRVTGPRIKLSMPLDKDELYDLMQMCMKAYVNAK